MKLASSHFKPNYAFRTAMYVGFFILLALLLHKTLYRKRSSKTTMIFRLL